MGSPKQIYFFYSAKYCLLALTEPHLLVNTQVQSWDRFLLWLHGLYHRYTYKLTGSSFGMQLESERPTSCKQIRGEILGISHLPHTLPSVYDGLIIAWHEVQVPSHASCKRQESNPLVRELDLDAPRQPLAWCRPTHHESSGNWQFGLAWSVSLKETKVSGKFDGHDCNSL